jgi:hypothetical protein
MVAFIVPTRNLWNIIKLRPCENLALQSTAVRTRLVKPRQSSDSLQTTPRRGLKLV